MRHQLRFPILLFVAARTTYALFSFLGLSYVPTMHLTVQHGRAYERFLWLDGLCRLDCGWYLWIARDGYNELQKARFWPLFPTLISLLSKTGFEAELAAILISAAFQLLALVVLYRLFTRLTSEHVARWSLLAYVAYPFGFFQGAGYAEGALTCLTAAAVLAAVERRPVWVALFLAAGLLARHMAVFTALAVAPVLWFSHDQATPVRRRVLSLWPLLSQPLVLVLWNAYLQRRLGVPLAFIEARKAWGDYAYWSIVDVLRMGLKERFFVVVALLLGLGTIPLLRNWRRPAANAALVGLALMGSASLAALLAIAPAALGRHSSSVWPLFLGWGLLAARRPGVVMPVAAISVSIQALHYWLFTHNFPMP